MPDIAADLAAAFPAGALLTDRAECRYYAQDVHSPGPEPLAVFRPASIAELAQGLKAAAASGLAIVPRGGGMSYTRGYVADQPGALLVDLGRMNRVLAIDETDMTVTVEAGITWAELYAALKPKGLRTAHWGTLSGIRATVGGGMSQNGLFWGAGQGTMAPSAITFDVVLADGSIFTTGSGFLRPFGPDITGLFACDSGAFGVKAHVTLPLVRESAAFAYGSFAFDTPETAFAAMSEVARARLASECFGFDPFLQSMRMQRDSLTTDAKALVGMMKAQGGFWKAMQEGARVVAAGRSFLDDANFSIHYIADGRTRAEADHAMAQITRIAVASHGRAVENTVPKILHANPFPPVNSMLGPKGERWVPTHGIVRHSRATQTVDHISALYERHAAEMERLGIGAGYMFLTVGATGFLVEPVFYFPDEMGELHRRAVEPQHLKKLKGFARNDEARALVNLLREGLIAIFTEMEAVHMQIGRTYPLLERAPEPARRLLQAVKHHLDPDQRMNPGVLGL